MKRIYLYLALSLFTFGMLKYLAPVEPIQEQIIISEEISSSSDIPSKDESVKAMFYGAPSLREKANILLKAGGIENPEKIKVKSHDDTSCSDDKTIWMNTGWELGPQNYVLAHECGHVICGHYKERCERNVTDAEMKEQEIEADLMACKLLCDLNMHEIVQERIKEIQYAIDQKWKQFDTNDHPSLQEMIDYIREFYEDYKSRG